VLHNGERRPVTQETANKGRDSLLRRLLDSFFIGRSYSEIEREHRPTVNNLILHIHPRTLPEQTLKFTLTCGLGGMALVLFALLASTGVLLMFVYKPFPGEAYDSIVTLQTEVLFGQLIRNIHHWSGNILLIMTFLHMLRVFFTGAFLGPRRFNWIIGLFLLLLVLVSIFTGYLLPWDQLAFWAITICTSMMEYMPGVGIWLQKLIRGGSEIGPATIMIFYTLHTTIIPFSLIIIMALHFWRVRKAGGVVIRQSPEGESQTDERHVPTIPNLVLRELVVALILIACILVFSIIVNAPLEDKANPGLSPNPTKAPWYFVGMQELLFHFHTSFAVLVIPILVTGALVLLPYLKYESDVTGVWLCSQRGRRMGVVSAVAALIITPIAIMCDEFFIDFGGWMPGVPTIISNGLLPLAILSAFLIGFHITMKKRYPGSNNETIQATFIFLLVAFIVLTIAGIWFRGHGMALTWPWNLGAPAS